MCASCGRSGHDTKISKYCANYVPKPPTDQVDSDIVISKLYMNVTKYSNRLPAERHDEGRMNIICTDCDAKMWISERVSGSSESNFIFHLCCNKGKSTLASLTPNPPAIAQLLIEKTPIAEEFRKHIRSYNSVLSFSSMSVKLDNCYSNSSSGAYTFCIQGSVYHRIGGLNPVQGETPKFAQIYIYDAENEHENRHSIASHISK